MTKFTKSTIKKLEFPKNLDSDMIGDPHVLDIGGRNIFFVEGVQDGPERHQLAPKLN